MNSLTEKSLCFYIPKRIQDQNCKMKQSTNATDATSCLSTFHVEQHLCISRDINKTIIISI